MKFIVFLIFILIVTGNAFGQKTFDVQDFSADYYGKVFLEQPAEVFSKGWVAIYQKKSNKQLIKIDSDELASDTESGKIKANVKELPYGEQSVIIYEDLNFDGVKDFAIMDGQNSCYHGPSFQIYLAGKSKDQFIFNKAFTKLAQEFCGMFEVDRKVKKLSTMTKSGCCWHQYSEYIVVNNRPKPVKIVEDDAMHFPFTSISTQSWNGKRKITTYKTFVDLEREEVKKLFTFKTSNGNAVILFSHGEQLHYVFADKTGEIKFAYPKESGEAEPKFTIDSKENPTYVTFTNKNAVYKIYEKADKKIGIEVKVNGKVTGLSSDITTLKGSLREVAGVNLGNINFKQ